MADHSHLDEDDVRVRPGRGKSRPRSKDRPAHEDAEQGIVVAVDRGRWTCVIGSGENERVVTAMRAREMGRKGIVVGDFADLVGDLSGSEDSLARIVRIGKRTTTLRRTADDTDPEERVIVANADQLAVVVALANPAPQTRLVDRAIVAALDAGMKPILILTKSDLADPQDMIDQYAALDVQAIVTQKGQALTELINAVTDHRTVFLGASGVGKSTLVNALVPSADRSIGHVNAVTGRGRHTSTSAVALELPAGGWVIDTPGIRSFGIAHVQPDKLIQGFADLASGTQNCPRGCSHDEPECALDAWVEQGESTAQRLDSLRRLMRSRTADPR
ncbi:MAG: ribosome small subunit-dependent GTPase A [Actinomycetes bacterium]|jgi:ribosome biogenesis GTPase